MRKVVLTAIVTFVITLGLFGPSGRTVIPPVEAQAATAKSDLISVIRKDSDDLLKVRASYRQHRARYDALSFSWVDGDFSGSNAGITASQFTSAVTNLGQIFDAVDSGGTLTSGLPTNLNRISY